MSAFQNMFTVSTYTCRNGVHAMFINSIYSTEEVLQTIQLYTAHFCFDSAHANAHYLIPFVSEAHHCL